jgi:hypothetical protein
MDKKLLSSKFKTNLSIPMSILRRFTLSLLAFQFLVICFGAATSHATTFYVSKGADGSNPTGGYATGWGELGSIVWTSVQPGDTLEILY